MKIASWAVVKTSGRPPASGQSMLRRHGHRLALVYDDQLALAAAAGDRHHAIAFGETRGAGAERGHFAGELETGDVLR